MEAVVLVLKLFAIGNLAGLHQLSEDSVVCFSVTKFCRGFKLGALVNHMNPDMGVGFLLFLFVGFLVVFGVIVVTTDSSFELVLVLVLSVLSGGLLVVV